MGLRRRQRGAASAEVEDDVPIELPVLGRFEEPDPVVLKVNRRRINDIVKQVEKSANSPAAQLPTWGLDEWAGDLAEIFAGSRVDWGSEAMELYRAALLGWELAEVEIEQPACSPLQTTPVFLTARALLGQHVMTWKHATPIERRFAFDSGYALRRGLADLDEAGYNDVLESLRARARGEQADG